MTVNAVALGGILTDMYLENSWYYAPNGYPGMPMEQIDKGIASLYPLGRRAQPLDVARVVCF